MILSIPNWLMVHWWLAGFAAEHGLRPQLELTRTRLYLVVGSVSDGRVEIDALELSGMAEWSDIQRRLEANRGRYREIIETGLRKPREVELNGN